MDDEDQNLQHLNKVSSVASSQNELESEYVNPQDLDLDDLLLSEDDLLNESLYQTQRGPGGNKLESQRQSKTSINNLNASQLSLKVASKQPSISTLNTVNTFQPQYLNDFQDDNDDIPEDLPPTTATEDLKPSSSGDNQPTTVGGTTILNEDLDEDYEPTDEEIAEYAEFLGLDPEKEPHLLWIAKEGLRAPLPKDWKPCQTDDGQVYYFNFSTGESVWDHPCDEIYRNMYLQEKARNPVPPAGWVAPKKSTTVSTVSGSGATPATTAPPSKPTSAVATGAGLKVTPSEIDVQGAAEDEPLGPLPSRSRTSSSGKPKTPLNLLQLSKNAQVNINQNSVDSKSRKSLNSPVGFEVPIVDPNSPKSQVKAQRKSFLGSILDHLDETISSAQVLNAPTNQSGLVYSGTTGSMQLDTGVVTMENAQNEYVTKALNDRVEDIKQQFVEREREERQAHEAKLTKLIKKLELERKEFEEDERIKMNEKWLEEKKAMTADLNKRREEEEARVAQEYGTIKESLKAELDRMKEQEKKKLQQKLQDDLDDMQHSAKKKFEQEVETRGLNSMVEKRKKEVEAELREELSRTRKQFEERFEEVKNSYALKEKEEITIQKEKLEEVRNEYAVQRQEEIKNLESKLNDVKERWNDRIRSAENELQSRDTYLRAQLTEGNQRKLKDTEAEFKRQYSKLEQEWKDKINRLKIQLANEQNELEEQLVRSRQETLHNRTPFSASLSVRKQDLDEFTRENDKLFSQQKRRRDFLDNEKKLLDQMENQLAERKKKLTLASFKANSAPPHVLPASAEGTPSEYSEATNNSSLDEVAGADENEGHGVQNEEESERGSVDVRPEEMHQTLKSHSRPKPPRRLKSNLTATFADQPQQQNGKPSKSRLELERSSTQGTVTSTIPMSRSGHTERIPSSRSGFDKSFTRTSTGKPSTMMSEFFDGDLEASIRVPQTNNPHEQPHQGPSQGMAMSHFQDQIHLPAVDGTRLSRELERSLVKEQRTLEATKQYLMDQQTQILTRQQELNDSRMKWKEQMETLNNKALATADVDLGILKDDGASRPVALDDAPAMSRDSLAEDILGDDPLRHLRENSNIRGYPGIAKPSHYFTGSTGGVTSAITGGFRTTIGGIGGGTARPISTTTLGDSVGRSSRNAPRMVSTSLQLTRWEEDRKKSDDLLKRHSNWLHDFKQKVSRERLSYNQAR